jgi:hypothetical protein
MLARAGIQACWQPDAGMLALRSQAEHWAHKIRGVNRLEGEAEQLFDVGVRQPLRLRLGGFLFTMVGSKAFSEDT